MKSDLPQLLEDLREYFSDRADADQPSGSYPIPNEEMTFLTRIILEIEAQS